MPAFASDSVNSIVRRIVQLSYSMRLTDFCFRCDIDRIRINREFSVSYWLRSACTRKELAIGQTYRLLFCLTSSQQRKKKREKKGVGGGGGGGETDRQTDRQTDRGRETETHRENLWRVVSDRLQ